MIKDIPLKKCSTLFGISFLGGPGVGKSTLSQKLSQKLKIPVVINDQIRRQLETFGINPVENDDLVKKLAVSRINYLLEHQTSMILDSNSLKAYKKMEEDFQNYHAPVFFIELRCSEVEILRRIKERKENFDKDKTNYSRAVEEDYYEYLEIQKNHSFPKEKIFFTIDTEKELEKQIENFVEKLKKYINI